MEGLQVAEVILALVTSRVSTRARLSSAGFTTGMLIVPTPPTTASAAMQAPVWSKMGAAIDSPRAGIERENHARPVLRTSARYVRNLAASVRAEDPGSPSSGSER